MLKCGGEDFTRGRARFVDRPTEAEEPTAKIYVKIEPVGLGVRVLAQLDTGSPWSILAPEIADSMGMLDAPGEPARLNTPDGLQSGRLVRVPLIILADEGEGDSLEMEATIFVCPDWPRGRNLLGYSGLLEFIRFAVDPQASYFYFGPYPA